MTPTRHSEPVEALLDAAAEALEASDPETALERCARARKSPRTRDDAELAHEVAYLEGVAWGQLGENERALKGLEEALAAIPTSLEAALEKGLTLFELCRFEAAEKELTRLLERSPNEAWAHHTLGSIAERRGDLARARRHFARARRLDGAVFPKPIELSEEEFDAAVEDAVNRLPEHVKPYLENAVISVEPLPSEEDLLSEKPPLSPSILGIFRGTPVGQRSVSNAQDHFPAAIILYQSNLQRFASSRSELIEQIGITVMHEVGHLLGLDEEDLVERGLD
jgi:predicted Zn-dependent protease with MMP-like domain